jgi:protein TIF31
LIRMFPPDVHFMEGFVEAKDLSEEAQKEGYPRKFPHKLANFRPELVDSFLVQKQEALEIEMEATAQRNTRVQSKKEVPTVEGTEKHVGNSSSSTTNNNEPPSLESHSSGGSPCESHTLPNGAKPRSEELDIRFNPDVFTPSVKHVDPDGVECKRQKEQIVALGEFLLKEQIPAFLAELTQLRYDPTLSEGILIRLRNNFGINVRYLGMIAEKLRNMPELSYPFTVIVGELIARSAKHLFRQYLQCVGQQNLAGAVSHFLNCMFGSCPNPQATTPHSLANVQIRKRRAKKAQAEYHRQQSIDYRSFTPKTLWTRLKTDLSDQYGFNLEG